MPRQFLTSLMKKKFGVTRSSTFKITQKDTLYTTFRKLADYIYKNGDWTEEDRLSAVETMVRNRERFFVGMIDDESKKVEVLPCTPEEREELKGLIHSYIPYTAKVTRTLKDGSSKTEIRYVLLDEQNKVGTKHNKYYWLGNPNHGNQVKKTYGFGNVNRAIGYDRIIRDLVEIFKQQKEKLNEIGVTMTDIQRFLHNVTSSEYSGKKWQYLFTKSFLGELTEKELDGFARDESPRYWGIPPEVIREEGKPDSFRWRDLTNDPNSRNKLNLDEAPYLIPSPYGSMYSVSPKIVAKKQQYNRVLQFIEEYLETSYDLILQQEYEKSIDQFTRASAWQTKKQIKQETKNIMEETTLRRYFGFVELDNDVDLDLFYEFEQEMAEIFPILPQVESIPDLRLRKLGNYQALGLYHGVSNTIAIDFRGPEDKDKSDYAPNQNGIQSFIHEYGHFLDYNARNDGQLLSIQPDFKKVVAKYRENIQHLPATSLIRKKSEYYGTPTEVFARAFELYSSKEKFETSFIKRPEIYEIEEEYQCFDKEMVRDLVTYFDQTFPEYKEKINEFQYSKEFVLEEESTEDMEMGM
ncbi:hypothetical protein O1F49_002660 [Enterococcus hirae]|nr:hypothetical protein [Enterococcus hirae]